MSAATPDGGEAHEASPRIVVCGMSSTSRPFLEGLLAAGEHIDAFVTIPEDVARRNRASSWFDYGPFCAAHGIPLYHARRYDLTAPEDVSHFRENRYGVIVQAGWQRLFPGAVLETLSHGALGLHGSADFLPKGRGRSPLNWSLIEGRRRFLLHLFLIKAGVDDGDVIDVEDFDILPFDDVETLYLKLAILNLRMHLRALPALRAGAIIARPQAGTPSYYPKRTAEDGLIDWEEWDVWRVHDFVRALARPYPGAFGLLRGTMTRIWRAQPFDTRITYPGRAYGEVVEAFDGRLVVNCRGGLLLVTEHEPMEAGSP